MRPYPLLFLLAAWLQAPHQSGAQTVPREKALADFYWRTGHAQSAVFYVQLAQTQEKKESPKQASTLDQLIAEALKNNPDIRVAESTWKRLNLLWVAFYALLGAVNLFVAFNLSEHVWVTFKFVGLPVANLLFVGAQVAWLVRRFSAASHEPSPQP